jgi:ankyrin repeat protein
MSNELVIAAARGDLEEVRRILDAGGVDINYLAPEEVYSLEGYSVNALGAAAGNNQFKIVDYLISKGVGDLPAALQIVCLQGRVPMVKHLLNKIPSNKDKDDLHMVIMSAASKGHLETVKYLLEDDPHKRFDLNYTGNGGEWLLAEALRAGHSLLTEYLLDKGAHIVI